MVLTWKALQISRDPSLLLAVKMLVHSVDFAYSKNEPSKERYNLRESSFSRYSNRHSILPSLLFDALYNHLKSAFKT